MIAKFVQGHQKFSVESLLNLLVNLAVALQKKFPHDSGEL
jgi:hypothetical protein